MAFDPSQFGAKPVGQAGTFDPTKFGAKLVATKTGFPTGEPEHIKQSFLQRLTSNLDQPAYDMNQNDSGLGGTLAKEGANIFKSGLKFAKGTVDFLNPKNTFDTIKQIPGAFAGYNQDLNAALQSDATARAMEAKVKAKTGMQPVAKPTEALGLTPDVTKAAYETVVPDAAKLALRGKGTEAVASLANDPFQVAPALLAAKTSIDNGSLKDTKTGKAMNSTVEAVAKPVTAPVTATTKLAAKLGKQLAEFGTSQATGLAPKTIKTILENPEQFSSDKMQQYTRENIAQSVHSAIDERVRALSETGKGYESIRNSDATLLPKADGSPAVDFPSVLQKHKIGFTVDEAGNIKLKTTADSLPLNRTDVAALEDFINTYNQPSLSANGVLNAREAMSQLAKYDSAKTGNLERVARDLRSTLDTVAKEQLPGLAELDAQYAPEVQILKKVKKDYFNADGTFKDNAVSKIANLTNEGRQNILARLEKIQPGISKHIAILKAVEDIAAAKGQKVGTYARAGVAAFGAATLNVPAIIAAVLSSPEIATQILRGYGKTRGVPSSVVNKAIDVAARILNTDVKGLNVGLSIKDVSAVKAQELGQKINELNKQYVEKPTPANKKALDNAKALYRTLTKKDNGEIPNQLIQEAKKYKSAEEFVKAQLSATQYGDYTPALRKYGAEGYTPITELGVKPEKMVTIYRGIDDINGNLPRKINNGDFVTTDFDSALSYAGGPKDVVSMKVPAKYLSVAEAEDFKSEPFYMGSEYIYTKEVGSPITKSQLTDIWKKANQATPESSLLQEAKKYKSAEEFVNKQPKVYHAGTPDIKEVDLNKTNFSKTFYVSDKADYAKSFGGNKSVVNEMVLDPKANLVDMRKPSEELVSQIDQMTRGRTTGKTQNITNPDGTILSLPEVVDRPDFGSFSQKQVIQGIRDGKAYFAELPEIKKVLKKLGYDGQITSEVPYAKNIGVWNKEVIKTKSQLTDIWKKANKKLTSK